VQHRLSKKKWRVTAVATAAALAGAGALTFQLTGASAEGTDGSTSAGTQAAFTSAAAEYHVPVAVLMGVAHEESGWTAHQGYSTDGGWGLMDLTDVTPAMAAGGDAGTAGHGEQPKATAAAQHTLQQAAKLTGLSTDQLQHDTAANIRGGAALLASYQKAITGKLSDTPSDWTGAIAKYSRYTDRTAATTFVNDVFATMNKGATASTGRAHDQVTLDAAPATARPETAQLDKAGLKAAPADGTQQADCPPTVDCSFLPAASTNEQKSDRPSNGIEINEIVIHTTEETYDKTLQIFQDPTAYTSVNYVMRASDGAVTQMVPNTDVPYGDGNYWSNLHSVQIEHEGYSARGADWYTDAAYQQTARLVRYLADKYDVPLDREHIVGHDNVPAPTDSGLSGQHWDPGYGWDWARFMKLVGAPDNAGRHGLGKVGTAVTIDPGYATNKQTYTVCPADDPTGQTTQCEQLTRPSNELFVRSAPSDDAPLLVDPEFHSGGDAGTEGTNEVTDWSDTIQQGQQFVVAGQKGQWTAVWYDGQKAWFKNPGGRYTIPAHHVLILSAKGGTAAPVYGSAYPDASEYPAGKSPSTQKALTAPNYSIAPGQAYVATAPPAQADDYFTDGTVVKGAKKYYTVQFNHRYIHVNAADVNVRHT
jgi:N-acetyl-anhydromuramyl-L-alanine amidase AmpD